MYFLSRTIDELGFSSFKKEIERRARAGQTESFLYIVPTGAQARELINWVTECASPRAIRIPHILSLDDFIQRLAVLAKPHLQWLTDAESAVFVELALKDLLRSNSLDYFESDGASSSRLPIPRGTFELLLAGIAGLKEHGISPNRVSDDLKNANNDPSRKISDHSALRKANDVAAIYQAYENKLGDTFADAKSGFGIVSEYFELPTGTLTAQQLARIEDAIKSLFPKITDIFVGSFIELSEPAIVTLLSLTRLSGIRMVFGIDYTPENNPLFTIQERFVHRATESGLALITPKESVDRSNSTIALFRQRLKHSLFRNSQAQKLSTPFVHSFTALSTKDELIVVAKKIKKIISENEGVADLSQFCIASFRQNEIAPIANEIFREYGIPVNITDRARLDRSPVYLAFAALLDLAEFHFSRRALLRFLTTPYFQILRPDGQKVDASNLYEVISEYRLHQGSESWAEEIEFYLDQAKNASTLEYDDFQARDAKRTLDQLVRAHEDILVIEALVNPLRGTKRPDEFVMAIQKVIAHCSVVRSILQSSRAMISSDALEFDTRSYRALTELLDGLTDICTRLGLEAKELPISFYTERIRIAALRTRFAPRAEPGRGVMITSFEQTIGYEFDYLFLIGLNDGVFPELYTPSLFQLQEHQPSEDDKLIRQRYLFYQTLCTSKKEIFLSWQTKTSDGKSELSHSQFITSFKETFTVDELDSEVIEKIIASDNEFFRFSASRVPSASHRGLELGLRNSSLKIVSDYIPNAQSAQRLRQSEPLSPYSGLLAPESMTEFEREELLSFRYIPYSISQLETYALCPFKYLSKYILKLKPGITPDEDEGLSASEKGTILHDILYQLLTELHERKLDIRSLSDTEFDSISTEITKRQATSSGASKNHPFVRLDHETVLSPPEPGVGMLRKFIEAERRYESLVTKPSLFETSFGMRLQNEKGENKLSNAQEVVVGEIRLRGKIDRIDMDEEHQFFTITDYKSSSSKTRKDIDEGTSLQLPLYLKIAEDMLRVHFPGTSMQGVGGIYHKLLGSDSKQVLAIGVHEFANKAFIGRKGGDKFLAAEVETVEELEAVINTTIKYAHQYVEGIASGHFPLTTNKLQPEACKHCEFKKMCRVGEAMENRALRD
ncbi:MAG: PD-(D/E)XK nuclease family protein [bacterium]